MQEVDKNKRKELYIAFALLLLGFAMRWLYVLMLDIPTPIRGDAISYYFYAKNLLESGVFSFDRKGIPVADSYWAPGYPLFLAFCFKLADIIQIDFYPIVLFLQAVLGGFTVFFSYLFGRQFLSIKAAVIASVFIILSPHLNSLGGNFLSETLFTFWLIASLYFYQIALRKEQIIFWVIAGCSFGMSYLVNPVVLWAPFLISLFHILACDKEKKSLAIKQVSALLIVFVFFVAGWIVRGVVNVPEGRPSSGQRVFENLVIGSHPEYHRIWYSNATVLDPASKVLNPGDQEMAEYKNDHSAFYRQLSHRIFKDPAYYLDWYLIQKPIELWGWNILFGNGDIYVFPVDSSLYDKSRIALVSLVIMKQLHFWLFGLAIAGLLFVFRDKNFNDQKSVVSMYILLVYINVVYVVIHSDARYSVPMRPEMYLCAVYGFSKLVAWVNKTREGSNNSLIEKSR